MAADPPLSGNQEMYDMKRRITEMVRVKFARYGDKVLAVILGYAIQPARMPQLMERLGVKCNTRSVEASLDALAQFLAANGAQVFIQKAMNLHQKREEVKPIDVDKFEAAASAIAHGTATVPAHSTGSTAHAHHPPASSGIMITTPGYSGPERRSGERRSGNRRDGLAAINRNKRFGGDRRKELKGRRAEDRVRPERWWLHLKEHDEATLLSFLKKK